MKGAQNILAGKWKELRGALKKEWADIADDDLEAVEGEWERMIGLLQAKYGFARVEAERRVLDVISRLQQTKLLESDAGEPRRQPAVPNDQQAAQILADRWDELRGHITQEWSDLTQDTLDTVQGNWEQMTDLLQQTYGYARLEAKRRLLDVISRLQ
jgi:uncharacterized protein YjbJ (UPF0337 family)